MKKKIVSLFLASMMLMSMAACSKDNTDETKKTKSKETTVETTEETVAETEAPEIDAPDFRDGYIVDYPFANGSVMATQVNNGSATFENADGLFVAHIEDGGSDIKDIYAYYGKFDIVKDVNYTLSFKVSTDIDSQIKIVVLGEDGYTFCESATLPLYAGGEASYSFGFSYFDDLPNATLYIYYGNDPDNEPAGAHNISFSELYLFETPEEG